MESLKEDFEYWKEKIEDLDLDWRSIGMVFVAVVLVGFLVFLFVQPKTYFTLDGNIVDKAYIPASTSYIPVTTCDSKGSCTTTNNMIYNPPSYNLLVRVGDQTISYSVSSNFYGYKNVNDKVLIQCAEGKIVKAQFCYVVEQ